ncbi:hypothetical protein TrST_g1607 [Triparma strigata]|uniref:Uncharacterized protein n=1 Tax=Triparma strigata TaxID=1606541 RepID=A0A9W7A0J6_9STRA|nr:hypothetical protein TrST_g1607 [Triparma strigata]
MVDEGGETSNGLALLPSAEEKGRGRMEDGEEVVILLTGKVLEGLEAGGGEDVTVVMVGAEEGGGKGRRVEDGVKEVFGRNTKVVRVAGEEDVEAALEGEGGKLVLVVHFKKFCDKVARRVVRVIEKRAENMESTIGRIGCDVMGGTFSFYELAAGSRGGMMVVCLGCGGDGGDGGDGEEEREVKEGWEKLLTGIKAIVKRPRDLIKI